MCTQSTESNEIMTNLSDYNNENIIRNGKKEKEENSTTSITATRIKRKSENFRERNIGETEHVEKEFFDQINKKYKIQNEEEKEQQEEIPFSIHYYEWEQIPSPLFVPYGLVIEENNKRIKQYEYIKKKEKEKPENINDSSSLENTDVSCSEHIKDKDSMIQQKTEKEKKQKKQTSGKIDYDEMIDNIIYEDILEYVNYVNTTINKIEKINRNSEGKEEEKEEKKEGKEKEKTISNQKHVQKEIEINWKNDFITLTNIQIIAKHTNKIKQWEHLKNMIPFIIHLCCSPRSSICKNSFLTIKHVCTSLKHDKINLNQFFVNIFPFIIKKLDIKNNFLNDCAMKAFEEFMLYNINTNDYEILRLLCSESNNKNPTISKKMSYFVHLYLKNISKEDLTAFNLSSFVEPFLNFINAKLEDTKKNMKQIFALFLEVKSEEEIIDIFKNKVPEKNKTITEKQIKHIISASNDSSLKKKHMPLHQFKCMKKRKSNNDIDRNNMNV